MVPEIKVMTHRVICHFGPFPTLWTSKQPKKIKILKKWKKSRDIFLPLSMVVHLLQNYLFFTKYTLFTEKKFIWKKNFILIFFYWKTFFTENEKIHVSFEKYLFIQNLYIPSAKKFFLIIWSLKFQKRTICGIP